MRILLVLTTQNHRPSVLGVKPPFPGQSANWTYGTVNIRLRNVLLPPLASRNPTLGKGGLKERNLLYQAAMQASSHVASLS